MTSATLARPKDEAAAADIATFKTRAEWKAGLRTDVVARRFSIPVDEPVELGGDDSAPNPMELLLAGLNGCLAVVIRVIAKEWGAEVTAIRFTSEASLDLRGFLGTADVQPHFQTVHTRIELGTDLDDEKFEAFTEAVRRRCPAGSLIDTAGVQTSIEWVRI